MKLNLSLIEKDPVLRNRLKEAAKESVRDFFSGRDPPEEALEYVVAAFCLGEPHEELNKRLKLLFEKDCTPIIETLKTYVEGHPEFTTSAEKETKKEESKKGRQKIVWDTSLDKKAQQSGEDKKKSHHASKHSKTPNKEHHTKPPDPSTKPDTHRKRALHGSNERGLTSEKDMDRWQPDLDRQQEGTVAHLQDVMTEAKHIRTSGGSHRKVPRSRLFQSALGSIKQQFVQKSADDSEMAVDTKPEMQLRAKKEPPHRNGHSEQRPLLEPMTAEQKVPSQPVQKEESILDRIRKPDGSAFEEWELKRDPPRGKKRQAEPQPSREESSGLSAAEISEVESLKMKIARLEQQVQSVQAPPPPAAYYPPALPPNQPPQDVDRWSVCVKNVHFLANEEVVAAHFHSCSPIVNIYFAKNRFGRSKGFCFIQFGYEDCVNRALELDQSLLLGRTISVVRKLTRPPVPSPTKPTLPGEWNRMPWKTMGPTKTPPGMQKEEWNNGGDEMAEPQDINDFAIDTGSQDLP